MDAPPVQYVKTSDGYNIAYAVCGAGPAIVVLAWPFEHVQLAWQYPGLAPWLEALAAKFTLVQFDTRGSGMSSRQIDVDDGFEGFQRDLVAVVERLRLDQVILWGVAAGCFIAARYAVEHRNKVKALILSTPVARPRSPAFWSAVSDQDWEMFLHSLVPRNRSPDEAKRQVELLREAFDQENFGRRVHVLQGGDQRYEELLQHLATPALVLHARDYALFDPAESMRSAQLAGASLTLIDGSSIFGDAEQGVRAVESFLAGLSVETQVSPTDGLSPRELEVLRLLAAGKSNAQIADELVISLNTVNRHVSNIYGKTGAANRAQAVAYAKDRSIA